MFCINVWDFFYYLHRWKFLTNYSHIKTMFWLWTDFEAKWKHFWQLQVAKLTFAWIICCFIWNSKLLDWLITKDYFRMIETLGISRIDKLCWEPFSFLNWVKLSLKELSNFKKPLFSQYVFLMKHLHHKGAKIDELSNM